MTQSHNLVRASILFGFALCAIPRPFYGQASANAQDQERNALELLEASATALQAQETADPSKHDARVAAFAKAAKAISVYSAKYTAAGDLNRLKLMYRFGVNLELSEQFNDARAEYVACEQHPQYHAAGAIYNGSRIDVLVPARLLATFVVTHPVDSSSTVEMVNSGYVVSRVSVNGSVIDPGAVQVHIDGHDLGNLRISNTELRTMIAAPH